MPIDSSEFVWYNTKKFNIQTVEAEITAMMPLQRACDAENQARNKLSNGPLRAQSNVILTEYSATLQADVICRGYVGILLSARVIPWIKVAPRVESYCRCIYSSLTEAILLSGTFFIFIKLLWREILVKGAFLKGGCNMLLTRYWRCFCAPDIEFK